MRHECEHKLDDSHHKRFREQFAGQIDAVIAADRQHIDQWEARIANIGADSSIADIIKMEKLFELLDDREPEQSPMDRQARLLNVLQTIQKELERCMPSDPSKPHPLYKTKEKQLDEIPPIFDKLRAHYGRAFIRELLPGISDRVRFHSLTNPGLRDAFDTRTVK